MTGNISEPQIHKPSEFASSSSALDENSEHDLLDELHSEVSMAGCFRSSPGAYFLRMGFVVGIYVLGFVLLLGNPDWSLRLIAISLVALASVQAGFIAHDAGDGAITKNRLLAFLYAQTFMTLGSALSCSYFDYFHRVHHKYLERVVADGKSSSTPLNDYEGRFIRKLVSGNGLLFVVVMVCLRGLSFKLESLRYLRRNFGKTKWDQFFLVLHVGLWLILPLFAIDLADALLNYTLITLFAGPYIGTVLLVNHAGMSSVRSMENVSKLQRVTMTTRNLGSSWWSDFIFGGVNNHIEHHLFQEIPASNLSKVRQITRDFCRRHKLPYEETSYLSALREVTNHFQALTPQRLANESLT